MTVVSTRKASSESIPHTHETVEDSNNLFNDVQTKKQKSKVKHTSHSNARLVPNACSLPFASDTCTISCQSHHQEDQQHDLGPVWCPVAPLQEVVSIAVESGIIGQQNKKNECCDREIIRDTPGSK